MPRKGLPYKNNLHKYRLWKGIVQSEISDKTGISVAQIRLIEKNKSYPRKQNRDKLLSYFNVSFNQMFYKDETCIDEIKKEKKTPEKISKDEKLKKNIRFKNRIKEYRSETGYSLDEISEKTGLTKVYLYTLETNKRFPRPKTRKLLMECFKASFDDLFYEVIE